MSEAQLVKLKPNKLPRSHRQTFEASTVAERAFSSDLPTLTQEKCLGPLGIVLSSWPLIWLIPFISVVLREVMSGKASQVGDQTASEAIGNYGDTNPYDQLQNVRTELDLVRCSEDIEDDLLEASLEEYQFVLYRKCQKAKQC